MTSSMEDTKAIRIVDCSGNASDWDEWSEKFQALAVALETFSPEP